MHSSTANGTRILGPTGDPSFEERRRRLALECELDRLNLKRSLIQANGDGLVLSVLRNVIPLAEHLPGRIGRWSRSVSHGAELARGLFRSLVS